MVNEVEYLYHMSNQLSSGLLVYTVLELSGWCVRRAFRQGRSPSGVRLTVSEAVAHGYGREDPVGSVAIE